MCNYHKTQWCIAEYLFQRNKELCSHNKYVHEVCRNFIHNSQKLDPTELPLNLCMLEQCYSHTMRYCCCCCCCWVTSVMSDSVRPYSRQPTGLPHLWDSPGKNTGVGCHFLLQWMKVKSESEVTQSCLTLWEPMDCSLPGSSVHGIFQARVLEWGAIAFSNNEILVISKNKWAIDTCNNLNESPGNLERWKKKPIS